MYLAKYQYVIENNIIKGGPNWRLNDWRILKDTIIDYLDKLKINYIWLIVENIRGYPTYYLVLYTQEAFDLWKVCKLKYRVNTFINYKHVRKHYVFFNKEDTTVIGYPLVYKYTLKKALKLGQKLTIHDWEIIKDKILERIKELKISYSWLIVATAENSGNYFLVLCTTCQLETRQVLLGLGGFTVIEKNFLKNKAVLERGLNWV